MADFTDVIILLVGWGLGIISTIITIRYREQSQNESDKRTLINELNQILQTQKQSTWIIIKTDVFDDLRTRSFYSSLPQEKRELIEIIYSLLLNKNNLITIKNMYLKESTPLGTTSSEIVVMNGENLLSTPINLVIARNRMMIEENIKKLLEIL